MDAIVLIPCGLVAMVAFLLWHYRRGAVTVQDREGRVRSGYVRCGGFLFGLLSDRADVRWDPDPPDRPGFPVIFPDQTNERRE